MHPYSYLTLTLIIPLTLLHPHSYRYHTLTLITPYPEFRPNPYFTLNKIERSHLPSRQNTVAYVFVFSDSILKILFSVIKHTSDSHFFQYLNAVVDSIMLMIVSICYLRLSFNHMPGKESSENIKSMFHICFDSSLQIKWYVECVILIRWFHMGLGRVSFPGSNSHDSRPDWDKNGYDRDRLT